MASLISQISKLNPFSDAQKSEDDEDLGEGLQIDSKAGGGHAGRESDITRHKLQVSHAMRSFLIEHDVLSLKEAGLEDPEVLTNELRDLLNKPHIRVPPVLTDRSHPLPNYFISSSHNTYLLANQLYGSASAQAYRIALAAGSRCVEIDAWDGTDKEEPMVTHGYTLTSRISFRSVCETIRDVVDEEAAMAVNKQGYRAAPILLSLENHCNAEGQRRLVAIMEEIFDHRLLSKAIRDKGTREQEGTGEHVKLEELGSKITVIVEYHFPGASQTVDEIDSDEEDQDSDEERRKARLEYNEKKIETASTNIIPELAELGIYAQSVKPPNNLWFESGELKDYPHHPLINVSESGLGAHMPKHNASIARFNLDHLMRVYPRGTRISSTNLHPVPFWGIGAQICALNWQTFGASMQINEAMFSGTDGFVLKPQSLRTTGGSISAPQLKKKLRLHVAGATDIPVPKGRNPEDLKPYLTCTLVHPSDLTTQPPKRKTSPYKPHKLGFFHKGENPPPTDPVWDETLEWEYVDDELVFLRLLIKSDDAFARNPVLVVSAVRLLYVEGEEGWRFIRMLDLKGRETVCSILVKFEICDAEG